MGEQSLDRSRLAQQPLSMETRTPLCHPDRSEAERRDLRFHGPFVDMLFSDTRTFLDDTSDEKWRR